LEQELRSDYGLSVIESRVLVGRVEEFIGQLFEEHDGFRAPGQICYVAVAEGQPAGRPLSHCVTIPILLTVFSPEDAEVLGDQGSVALRRARLHRLTHEARRQGGLLSYEDLSLLLAVDVTTVRRLVRRCRQEGLQIPSRGLVSDIGPGTSHKSRVIELLFRGMQPFAIAAYTSHSLSSVERYVIDFARVVELCRRGYPKAAIVRITGLSPKTVREYLELMKRYGSAEHRPVFDMVLGRFCPVVQPLEDDR
jgi:transposase